MIVLLPLVTEAFLYMSMHDAIKSYLNSNLTYGKTITCWDVHQVSSMMRKAFSGNINTYIWVPLLGCVSSVIDIHQMFYQQASAFNQARTQFLGCFQCHQYGANVHLCPQLWPRFDFMGCVKCYKHATNVLSSTCIQPRSHQSDPQTMSIEHYLSQQQRKSVSIRLKSKCWLSEPLTLFLSLSRLSKMPKSNEFQVFLKSWVFHTL
jgi:hypothetical protein